MTIVTIEMKATVVVTHIRATQIVIAVSQNDAVRNNTHFFSLGRDESGRDVRLVLHRRALRRRKVRPPRAEDRHQLQGPHVSLRLCENL